MHYLSLDHLIVYAFLLITLIVGILAGRGIKDFKDYIIGHRRFGTMALVLTFFATDLGGASIINIAGKTFDVGIIITIAFFGIIINFLMMVLIVPKVVHLKHCLTIGDIVKTFYGHTSGIIAGVLGLFSAICVAGMEIVALGIICGKLLGIDAHMGIMVGGLILTLYSAHGGIKAVVTTDIIQFLMLIVGIPIIAYMVVHEVGGLPKLFEQIPSEKLVVWGHKDFAEYLSLFLVLSIFPACMVDGAIIQRWLMGRTKAQLRKQYLVMAAFDPVFQILVALIGLGGFLLYPTIESAYVVPHVINQLLPMGFKGIAIAGLVAMSMSTIDSYLHVTGVILVHDVIKPLVKKKDINEKRWAQIVTLLLGLITIGIGLSTTDMFGLLMSSFETTGPLLMFPLMAGIMGLKTDKRSFYVAMCITLLGWGSCKLWLSEAYAHFSLLISILANGFTFFGMHILQNKGLAIVNRQQGNAYLWQPRKKSVRENIQRILPTPHNIVVYSQKKIKQYGAPYVLFGIFCCINFILPYFMWVHSTPATYRLMLTLRFFGAVLCALLIVKDKWPKNLQAYLPTFWHFTILYCLPFMGMVMFLLTQGNTEWLINLFGIIIALIVLLDWLSAVLIGILGIGLGYIFYVQAIGQIHFTLSFDSGYLLIYQIVFATLIGFLFALRRQRTFDTLTTRHQYLQNTHRATSKKLLQAQTSQERFVQAINAELTDEFDQLKQGIAQHNATSPGSKSLQQAQEKLKNLASYLQKIVYMAKDHLPLQITTIDIHTLIVALFKAVDHIDTPCQPKITIKKHTQQTQLKADISKIQQLILNSIKILQTHNPYNHPIILYFEDTQLGYALRDIPSYTKKIKALNITLTTQSNLPNTKKLYMGMGHVHLPQQESEKIIDAHYGHMAIETHTHTLVIPIDVTTIRPQAMDELDKPLPTSTEILAETHPGTKKLEQALMETLKNKTNIDLAVVDKAIAVIKKYHHGQKRKSGEPFYTHPMEVACLLLHHTQDQTAVIAALLHDTVEDTQFSLHQVKAQFGPIVSHLVSQLTNLEDNLKKLKLNNFEQVHRLSEASDPHVLQIKLADQLHNMRTIGALPIAKQREKANVTIYFYVPMAKSLGLTAWAKTLKELALDVLNGST